MKKPWPGIEAPVVKERQNTDSKARIIGTSFSMAKA
jgi:hypothetical protein